MVTLLSAVEAATLKGGATGLRGLVSRGLGVHELSEAQASAVEDDVGIGVGVGAGDWQNVIAIGIEELFEVPSPSCPFEFDPQHIALHRLIHAHA
jgi:hypothetical protein